MKWIQEKSKNSDVDGFDVVVDCSGHPAALKQVAIVDCSGHPAALKQVAT